jgi:hypothetical protein
MCDPMKNLKLNYKGLRNEAQLGPTKFCLRLMGGQGRTRNSRSLRVLRDSQRLKLYIFPFFLEV